MVHFRSYFSQRNSSSKTEQNPPSINLGLNRSSFHCWFWWYLRTLSTCPWWLQKKQKMFKITIWKRLTLSDSKIGSKSCKMFVKIVKKLFHTFLLALPDPDSLFLFSPLIWHSWNQTLRGKWWKCKSKRKALLFFPKQGGEWWWVLGWRHIPLLLLVLVNSLLKDLYSSTRLWHHLALSWLMEVNKSKIKPLKNIKFVRELLTFTFTVKQCNHYLLL